MTKSTGPSFLPKEQYSSFQCILVKAAKPTDCLCLFPISVLPFSHTCVVGMCLGQAPGLSDSRDTSFTTTILTTPHYKVKEVNPNKQVAFHPSFTSQITPKKKARDARFVLIKYRGKQKLKPRHEAQSNEEAGQQGHQL